MNIFYLHSNPSVAASLMYQRHKIKMIVESAQMLCTAHHVYGTPDVPYKKTHLNHPSSIWARENVNQYNWLYDHMIALGEEYHKSFNKNHLSIIKCREILAQAPPNMPDSSFQEPPQCMPEQYRAASAIDAYWNYYVGEKHSVRKKGESLAKRP